MILVISSFSFLNLQKPSTQSIVFGVNDTQLGMIEEDTSVAFAIVSDSLSCSPSSPYTNCTAFKKYDNAVYLGGTILSAKVESYSTVFQPYPVNNNVTSYYTGAKAGFVSPYNTGSQTLYFTDKCFSSWTSFWSSMNCSLNGCSGASQVSNPNQRTLVSGFDKTYTGCPTYISLTRNYVGGNVSYAGAAYYAKGMGSGNAVTIVTPSSPVLDCVNGQTKCVGTSHSVCQSNKWVSQGQVDGQCGYFAPECVVGEQSCVGSTLKSCVNGSWSYESNSSECVAIVCVAGESVCEGTTLKSCSNNSWVYSPNELECGYVPPQSCVDGETQCLESNLFVCQNSFWNDGGQVEGYCGVEPPIVPGIDVWLIGGVLGVIVLISGGVILFIFFSNKKGKKK